MKCGQMAAARNLPIHSKHDSMDLCFVVDDDYRRFLKQWAPDAMMPGEIVDIGGNVLGMHLGLPNLHGRAAQGAGHQRDDRAPVTWWRWSATATGLLSDRQRRWAGRNCWRATSTGLWAGRLQTAAAFSARSATRARPLDCTVYPQPDGSARVVFDAPARGISPGQGAVFYDGAHCLGGGLIAKADADGETAGARIPWPDERIPLT